MHRDLFYIFDSGGQHTENALFYEKAVRELVCERIFLAVSKPEETTVLPFSSPF